MNEITIKSESLPTRCEICHQSDKFNSVTNVCERCSNLNKFSEFIKSNKYHRERTISLYVVITIFFLGLVAIYWFNKYIFINNFDLGLYIIIKFITYSIWCRIGIQFLDELGTRSA